MPICLASLPILPGSAAGAAALKYVKRCKKHVSFGLGARCTLQIFATCKAQQVCHLASGRGAAHATWSVRFNHVCMQSF